MGRYRLGVGTAAVRFVGQIGAVLGVAVVGTVVNQTLADDIVKRLPANAVQQLTPAGLKYATDPQVLVNSTYRNSIVQTAQHYAVQSAIAKIPPGPQHNQMAASIAAQVMQQVQHLLNQVFDALKISLTIAIQHGLVAVLVFSAAMILGALFLKDIPLRGAPADVASQGVSGDNRSEGEKSGEAIGATN